MRVAAEPDALRGEAGRPGIHFCGCSDGWPRLAWQQPVRVGISGRALLAMVGLAAVVGCGSGAAGQRDQGLELGVELTGLSLAPDEYLCTTWAVYEKADRDDVDEWDP